jgi:hypothetical protein
LLVFINLQNTRIYTQLEQQTFKAHEPRNIG